MEEHKWADELSCAVTVCDMNGVVVYMNRRSVIVNGAMLGKSMIPCHNERSRAIIADLLATGNSNSYTIQKGDVRKMIHQTVWREQGEVRGLVEFSIEIPVEMPHYVRG